MFANFIFLSKDPFSSRLSFSMHDETSFTTNLFLSSGEDNIEFVKTELCLDGEMNYDVNIAKVKQSKYIIKSLKLAQ